MLFVHIKSMHLVPIYCTEQMPASYVGTLIFLSHHKKVRMLYVALILEGFNLSHVHFIM